MRRTLGWRTLKDFAAVGASFLLACTQSRSADPQAEIAAMLAHSAASWNRGDLAGFMGDYLKDSTSYVAGRYVQYGWQPLYDRYERHYFTPGKQRDSLSFDSLHAHALAPDAAYVTARFKLMRGDSIVASGPFTLILRKADGGWRIVHDHTTADPR
jgi:beta-aspartyl-peptidase (threonine type)